MGKPVHFSQDDVELFSAASGDRNPLHLSSEYARATAYGQPVLFGCLGALACLSEVALPKNLSIRWMQVEFLRPVFVGVSYEVQTSRVEEKWISRLFDGSLPVIVLTLKTTAFTPEQAAAGLEAPRRFERAQPVQRRGSDVAPGLSIAGRHACDPGALRALRDRWNALVEFPFLASMLATSSYLVGMEMPGESALFSTLTLDFPTPLPACPVELAFQAAVRSVNPQIGLAKVDVTFSAGDGIVAFGHYGAFVRPDLPVRQATASAGGEGESLKGRVALVVGASRGLGAEIVAALEERGATVYSLSRSGDPGGSLHAAVGDAESAETLTGLRERLVAEQGGMDILVCNACPPILPLRLEPNSLARIDAYMRQAVALTLSPLCFFLDLLNERNGSAVIISSAAVENPVRDWPHYMAAKNSVEMLARVACLQYPRVGTLIVRPPKLLTALTNTPMGRRGAASPAEFAARIASRLETTLEPGKTEILG